ncbi:MAG: class I SAM-dependent methyltransferase [Lachnoclostridium sp.]|nr:class I SAM-dependent methyltransferase [Lachnoclostridium sp.]
MENNQPEVVSALSDIRWNCVEWLEIQPDADILILGSGYGEVTSLFARRAGRVFCVDSSTAKSNINEIRNRNHKNVFIYAAYLEQMEAEFKDMKFDMVLIFGCLNNAAKYYQSSHKTGRDMIEFAASYLTETGKMIIVEDNKYGIKYFDGTRPDGKEAYFSSFLDEKQGGKMFSKYDMINLIKDLGMEYRFFYPYPDYKFAMSIFSDYFYPQKGQLNHFENVWERGKIDLFCQGSALEQMADDKMFDIFSNSFLVVLSKKKAVLAELPIYIKYANERSVNFSIRTEIYEKETGKRRVVKRPLSIFSKAHLDNIIGLNKKLQEKYSENPDINFPECRKGAEGLEFPYVDGETLENLVRKWDEKREEKKIIGVFDRLNRYLTISASSYFIASEKFREIFGKVELPANLRCSADGNNVDWILSNIIVGTDGRWNIIDCEWGFDFPIPLKFILYRAIFYGFSDQQNALAAKIYHLYGIDEKMREAFQCMERAFQRYILNGKIPIREIKQIENIKLFQRPAEIFFDMQENGWSKLNSRKLNAILGPDHKLSTVIPVNDDWKRLRIDPIARNCVIKIESITDLEGKAIDFTTNGEKIGIASYLYRTNDPQIVIEVGKRMKGIQLALKVFELDEEL